MQVDYGRARISRLLTLLMIPFISFAFFVTHLSGIHMWNPGILVLETIEDIILV